MAALGKDGPQSKDGCSQDRNGDLRCRHGGEKPCESSGGPGKLDEAVGAPPEPVGSAARPTPCWRTLDPRAGRELVPVFQASDRCSERLREAVKDRAAWRAADRGVAKSLTCLAEQQRRLRSLFPASVENQQRQQRCTVSGQGPCPARSADTGKGLCCFSGIM